MSRVSWYRRWGVWLAAVAAGGLVIRVAYVLLEKNPMPVAGDPFYYHHGANLLADGHGLVDPYALLRAGKNLPGAVHPPGYVVALAVSSVFGFRSFLDHQIWSCVIGAGTVVLMGLAGREMAGRRAGLVAAGVAAVYPNFWFSSAVVMSETLILFTTALTVLVAYRFWHRPSMRLAIGLGVAIGVTALTRAESIILSVVLVAPLVWFLRQRSARDRLKLFGIVTAATLVTIAPWVGYNLARFEHPVFLSSNLEATLASANCDQTYYGPGIGFWVIGCAHKPPAGDGSVQAQFYRHQVLDYVGHHKARVPLVMGARVARTFGLLYPNQQITFDLLDSREIEWSRAAFGMYYVLAAASVFGAVILRRRRESLVPVLAVLVSVIVSVALVYGTTRFRTPAEVSFVLLVAVAADEAIGRVLARRGRTARGAEAGNTEEQPPVVAVK